jgi:hypothetical protein
MQMETNLKRIASFLVLVALTLGATLHRYRRYQRGDVCN